MLQIDLTRAVIPPVSGEAGDPCRVFNAEVKTWLRRAEISLISGLRAYYLFAVGVRPNTPHMLQIGLTGAGISRIFGESGAVGGHLMDKLKHA